MYPTINLGAGDTSFNPLHAPYPSTSGSSAAAAPQPPSPPQPARANGPPGVPPPPAFPTLQVAIDPKFCVAPPVRWAGRGCCGSAALAPGSSLCLDENALADCWLALPTAAPAELPLRPPFPALPQVKAPSQPPGEGGPVAGGAAPPPPPGQPAPGGSKPLDLDLEQKLVEELRASGSGTNGSGSSGCTGGMQVGRPHPRCGAGATAPAPRSSLPPALAAAPPVPAHRPAHLAAPCLPPLQDPYEMLLWRYTDMGYSREEVAMGLAIAGPDAADDADKIGACVCPRALRQGGGAGGGARMRCERRRRHCCVRLGRRRCEPGPPRAHARLPAIDSCPLPPLPPPMLASAAAVESCRKFKSLASMGFRGDQVVGALILAQGDEEAAIQTCLDANAT